MSFIPYISFSGNCEEAFNFYAQVMKTKEPSFYRWKDAPSSCVNLKIDGEKIMHACIMLGDFALMGADCPPSYYQTPQGVDINFMTKDYDEAKRIFYALSQEGEITMPFDATFYSTGFGMLTDKFSVRWMIMVDQEPN